MRVVEGRGFRESVTVFITRRLYTLLVFFYRCVSCRVPHHSGTLVDPVVLLTIFWVSAETFPGPEVRDSASMPSSEVHWDTGKTGCEWTVCGGWLEGVFGSTHRTIRTVHFPTGRPHTVLPGFFWSYKVGHSENMSDSRPPTPPHPREVHPD